MCQDMGLNKSDEIQLDTDYQLNMNALKNATLAAGRFAWQMLWTGGASDSMGATCGGVHIARKTCTKQLRELCTADSPAQTRAMLYIFNNTHNDGHTRPELMQDLASFLLVRGPYGYLGHSWMGCGPQYSFPDELHLDYGEPSGLCMETAPNSSIFTRDWSRVNVTIDCNTWEPTLVWK